MRGRRVVRRGGPNRNVQIAQILTLLVLLIIVLTFRTKVSDSAGRFLQLFADDSDLAVVESEVRHETPDQGTSDVAIDPESTRSDTDL